MEQQNNVDLVFTVNGAILGLVAYLILTFIIVLVFV
jgi:hypothetical protein